MLICEKWINDFWLGSTLASNFVSEMLTNRQRLLFCPDRISLVNSNHDANDWQPARKPLLSNTRFYHDIRRGHKDC